MPKSKSIPDQREFLQGLAKGLAVLEAFGAGSPSLTLSEVARRTHISPGSARRVLLTLRRLGYIEASGQHFHLQPRTLQLGYAYLSSLPLTGLVQPLLTQLTRDIDESCSLGLLDGTEVVFVARAAARQLARDYMMVGMRYPAHATSVGKLLLAMLPESEMTRRVAALRLAALTPNTIANKGALLRQFGEIRERGWAFNDQETMAGLRSIAVPIRMDGAVAAGLTASSPAARHEKNDLISRLLPPLRETARTLEHMLAARRPAGAIATEGASPAVGG